MRPEFSAPTMRGFYGKGKAAAAAGLPRKCPYEPLPYMEKTRKAWFAGWDDASAKAKAAEAAG